MKFAITNPKEVERLLTVAKALSDFHWAVVKVLVDTGCHPKNIYDVRIEGDLAIWRRVKNAKTCFARADGGLVVAVAIIHSKSRATREWYYHYVKEVAVAADMPYVSPNTLRKTHCYRLLKAGYVAQEVAQMMGCSTRLINTVYCQIAPEDMMKIALLREVEQ